jgi:DNA-binding winged helix-turn-helix (wHTH) protein
MGDTRAHVIYEFGGFVLEPSKRQLRAGRDGAVVPLPARVLDTLICFVERPRQLLAKSVLLEAIWPDAAVEENSLARNISILRRALADDPASGRFIVTDQGRGYRFVADVRVVRADAQPETLRSGSEKHDLVMQARALSVRPGIQNLHGALEVLEQVLARDRDFAPAHSMLARVRSTFLVFDLPVAGGLATVERDARRALELDPNAGDAHAALGLVRAFQGRWIEAEEHFRSGLSRGAQPDTWALYVTMVAHSVGHFERALCETREFHRRYPGDAFFPVCAAVACTTLGMNTEAREYADIARRLGQPFDQAPLQDLYAELAQRCGDFARAADLTRAGLTTAMRAAGGVRCVDLLFGALADDREKTQALAALHMLEAALQPNGIGQVDMKRLIRWYTTLGAIDAAYATVNRCLDTYARIGTVGSAWGVLWGPDMESFRRHASFKALSSRLGFGDYWLRYGPPLAGADRRPPARG